MKILIGENEYRLPVTIDSCDETYTCVSDEDCKEVSKNDIVLALNELASLRQERDDLKKRVEELEKMIPKQGESVLRELFPDPKGGDNEV